ncbi:unnamed protein product [Closterium sp. NIES-53]
MRLLLALAITKASTLRGCTATSTTAAATSTTAAAASTSHTAATEAPTPDTTPTSTATPTASSTASAATPVIPSTTLSPLALAVAASPTRSRRSPDLLSANEVLQRFRFQFSLPQPTPLFSSHSLSTPPSDESVEPSGPYPELVGCLMYLMTCTRPDLAYPLSLLAHYVAPGRRRKVHWDAAKRVLRNLCSTSGMGLLLGGRGPVVLTGNVDASWVDDSAREQSSQGYTFSLGSGSVSWRSTHLSLVLSSSCEAEIYAGAMAAQELRWLTYLRTDLGEQPRSPPVMYVDNKAMIALCQEHRLEHRTKHITLRYFLARELQQRGQLRLAYVATRANNADIFTKALPPGDHQHFATVLGLSPFEQFREWLDLRKGVEEVLVAVEKPKLKVLVAVVTEKRLENDPENSPWVRKSAQGYLLLGQAFGSSQIRHLKPFQREPEKGPKAWAALKGVHAPATAAVAVVLERKMAALRIEEDEAVEEGQASAVDMAVEGAEDEGEADLAATTSMEAAGVVDTAATRRATDAVVADSTASATIVPRADIFGAIASSSLMDGPLLKAKMVEEQEEGEEEDMEAVAVAEVVLQV